MPAAQRPDSLHRAWERWLPPACLARPATCAQPVPAAATSAGPRQEEPPVPASRCHPRMPPPELPLLEHAPVDGPDTLPPEVDWVARQALRRGPVASLRERLPCAQLLGRRAALAVAPRPGLRRASLGLESAAPLPAKATAAQAFQRATPGQTRLPVCPAEALRPPAGPLHALSFHRLLAPWAAARLSPLEKAQPPLAPPSPREGRPDCALRRTPRFGRRPPPMCGGGKRLW
mmetsp:Transcript_59682/g.159713  ORF Transcript_59682/g.159713 Transcript_59682/m.159713 type:complete len:232 (+) Transcript_59682:618-1313(+)